MCFCVCVLCFCFFSFYNQVSRFRHTRSIPPAPAQNFSTNFNEISHPSLPPPQPSQIENHPFILKFIGEGGEFDDPCLLLFLGGGAVFLWNFDEISLLVRCSFRNRTLFARWGFFTVVGVFIVVKNDRKSKNIQKKILIQIALKRRWKRLCCFTHRKLIFCRGFL